MLSSIGSVPVFIDIVYLLQFNLTSPPLVSVKHKMKSPSARLCIYISILLVPPKVGLLSIVVISVNPSSLNTKHLKGVLVFSIYAVQ